MKIPNISDKDTATNAAGFRNKNPGNRTGRDDVFGSGQDSSGHHYTTYKDWVHGYAGNTMLLLRYLDGTMKSSYGLGKRNPCMISVIYTWAPPDDGNDSKDYVEKMCGYCGIEPDDKIPITRDMLIAMELAKGLMDSGSVHNSECRVGVDKAIAYYTKKGGRLDNNTNLGKDTSDLIQKLKSGMSIKDIGGSADAGSYGAVVGYQTPPKPKPNIPPAQGDVEAEVIKSMGKIKSKKYSLITGTHLFQNDG